MEPVIGNVWKSKSLKQSFRVIGGVEAWDSLSKTYPDTMYVGHVAERIPDKKLALVGLTDKPADYDYDFVLYS
jgi:hypothetical protein